jgi:hypothetical protein
MGIFAYSSQLTHPMPASAPGDEVEIVGQRGPGDLAPVVVAHVQRAGSPPVFRSCGRRLPNPGGPVCPTSQLVTARNRDRRPGRRHVVFHPDRCAVRPGVVPWRVPGQ